MASQWGVILWEWRVFTDFTFFENLSFKNCLAYYRHILLILSFLRYDITVCLFWFCLFFNLIIWSHKFAISDIYNSKCQEVTYLWVQVIFNHRWYLIFMHVLHLVTCWTVHLITNTFFCRINMSFCMKDPIPSRLQSYFIYVFV